MFFVPFVVKNNAPSRTRFFSCGEDRIRISSPQWGRAREQKRVPRLWRERVLGGGEDRIRTCDRGFRPGNRLAGGPIRPLWHLPNFILDWWLLILDWQSKIVNQKSPGGGSGIRTHVGVTQTCFQDMRLQPLGHPSTKPWHLHQHLRAGVFSRGRKDFTMFLCMDNSATWRH